MLNTFSYPELKFPTGFLWGTSTAAHQIEGGDIHSWNNYIEIQDNYEAVSGDACDHWNLWRSDADLMAELGFPAYRMSLSWARVEPECRRFNQQVIDRYVEEMSYLKSLGIKVFLTLFHGSAPLWFMQAGGFARNENVAYFEEYVRHIVPFVKDLVDGFNVINEFNLQYETDLTIAGAKRRNHLLAHARGYHIIKEYSQKPVSSAHALLAAEPEYNHDQFDALTSRFYDWIHNEFFFHAIRTGEFVHPYCDAEVLPEVKNSLDFWSVNYYCRTVCSARKAGLVASPHASERLRMIDKDFYLENIHPQGFVSGLVRLNDKPVYITENGISADDDRWRILKMATDLSAIHDAIKLGVDVRGYFHWSTMDNYEWSSFVPRFGLIAIDGKTMERTPKPSAHFLGEIIRENGFSGELVKRYLPGMAQLKLY